MKHLLLLVLFCAFPLSAQMIKGKIVNDLEKPIANVNIYLDGTTTGTISAQDGSFSLSLPSKNNNTLVFQKDYYETFRINSSEVAGKTLKVVLLRVQEIEELKIIPFTERAYKDYINYFLRAFIGEDRENVKIKNQRTLKFSYDKESKILRVKAPQTLIIENKKLGYTIDYNLQEFKADFENKTTLFIGTSFFRETKSSDKIKINRLNAFYGSQVHFFRSVYKGNTKEEGYTVNALSKIPNDKYPSEEELDRLKNFHKNFKPKETLSLPEDIKDISQRKANEMPYKTVISKMNIPESDYTKKIDGVLLLDFKDILQVNYHKYTYILKKGSYVKDEYPIKQTSYLHSNDNISEIYSNGNTSDPAGLMNQGSFSTDKIDKLLPLDYEPGD
ncbi:carboxypeptidase-like regulatory domain-containing protein [Chryseobacterium echinoideorum]|uniref:carboxypeptidase-like regulatory domain-containing protein n=1 Tax=Chryseobacterium echinoideorum TaxID=1549648 RepID=UPI00162361F1|nr:carboxypeptidase-like regulatory domain-containing protein [Chryseobacterium echinoideorum]